MISKELKSQLSILKETNPEYIQTLKDAVTASYKAELQAIKPIPKVPQPRDKQQPPPLRTHKITDKRNITNPTKRYNHNRYNITTMKKKDLIYIPHQDTWTERFPNPGSNKNDYTLYLSDPQAQYNKLLRTQQKLRNKKK